VSPHTLRHAFVTAALDAGASLRDVQDAAGHADPRTTRRYDRARHSLDRHPTYAVAATVNLGQRARFPRPPEDGARQQNLRGGTARRIRSHPRLLRPDHPAPSQPRRRPPAQLRPAHDRPHPPPARSRDPRLHREAHRRRQDAARNQALPQALPGPSPLPHPRSHRPTPHRAAALTTQSHPRPLLLTDKEASGQHPRQVGPARPRAGGGARLRERPRPTRAEIAEDPCAAMRPFAPERPMRPAAGSPTSPSRRTWSPGTPGCPRGRPRGRSRRP